VVGPTRRFSRAAPWAGLLPFLVYLLVFLVVPTITVVVGAFQEDGRFSLSNIRALFDSTLLTVLWRSVLLSGVSAVVGAVFGAFLAYLIVTRPARSLLRRVVTAAAGVLAQFGGLPLAFAFIATLGFSGIVTRAMDSALGLDVYGNGWVYALPGLMLVYTYFQIPLMVIVFLPALEGVRPQWREAAVNLGASTWQYWRQVAFPLLTPGFLGALLLLFANAFAAYATAAILVSQGQPILPLFIRAALTSEVMLGRQNLAFALAFEMVVVVAAVMAAYSLLLRRTSRWLR
jgi:putative spermidine/putrescine transport system permease protein